MDAGPTRPAERRAEVLLFLVALIWASNYPVVKWGIRGLDIFIFNAIRFLVGAVVAWGFFRARAVWEPVAPKDRPRLLVAGVVGNVLYQVAFIVGIALTTAGNAAVLMSTAPLWTLLLDARLHRAPVSRSMWTGMALSLVGVILIVIGSGRKLEFGSHAFVGDLVALLAGALWALNTTLQKPLVARYPSAQVTLVMLLVGAFGLSAIALGPALETPWTDIHWSHYAAAVASGAFAIGLSNVIWSHGVKRLGPGRTANVGNLIPVLAFVISYFTLDEEIYPIHFAGAAVTILGVWLARR
ncbi:MAG: DMT family transporter [Bacteroidota bacterium]